MTGERVKISRFKRILNFSLRGALSFSLAYSPVTSADSFFRTSQFVFPEYYSAVSLNDLETLNLELAELIRSSLYWGTPGSSLTPPTQSQIQQVETRVLRWRDQLTHYLPSLLSTQHPSGNAEISRLTAEVLLYFQAVQKLEQLKYLNRLGLSVEHWERHYALSIPLQYNGDYEFVSQVADLGQLQNQNTQVIKAHLTFGPTPNLVLKLNEALIEDFETQSIGRFQSTAENTVHFIQFTGASFLLDNLAEVAFLRGQSEAQLEEVLQTDSYWLEQFPVLRHKTALWRSRLDDRRWHFTQTQVLQNRSNEISAPLLNSEPLEGELIPQLVNDLADVWGFSPDQRQAFGETVRNSIYSHLQTHIGIDYGSILPPLVRLWRPAPDSSQEQLSLELRELALQAFGHILRYHLIYRIEGVVPPSGNLLPSEYADRMARLKPLWASRVDSHLERLQARIPTSHYAELGQTLQAHLRGSAPRHFLNLYVENLRNQSERTRQALAEGRLDLSILNQSLRSLYLQQEFSAPVIESLNSVTSSADYASARDFYFQILGSGLPPVENSAGEILADDRASADEIRGFIERNLSGENQVQRKKNLLDLVQAGEWLGFFRSQSEDFIAMNISDLSQLPTSVQNDYLSRLGQLALVLHPILSTTLDIPVSNIGQADPLYSQQMQRRSLMEALQTANEASALRYTEMALTQTQNNIQNYLDILKDPYGNTGLIGQLFGSRSDSPRQEFLSVVRYSSILRNHLQSQPGLQTVSSEWLRQQDRASETGLAWQATESFLFDRALWVILGIDLISFVARWSPFGRIGSALGWVHSNILAPVFGAGSKWLHRALLVGIGIHFGREIYEVVHQHSVAAEVENMLHTSAFDQPLTDVFTYAMEQQRAEAASQELLVKLGFLAAAMAVILGAAILIPRILSRMKINSLNRRHRDLLNTLGAGQLNASLTRSQLEAAFHATKNRIQSLYPHLTLNQALQMKHRLSLQFRDLLKGLNAEAARWEQRLHRGYAYQIETLYLRNSRFVESLGFDAASPITSEMLHAALLRWEAYAQSGQITALQWARIQDSAQQLMRAVRQREQVWGHSLLYGDAYRINAHTQGNTTGAWNPETMNRSWEENGQPLRFELHRENGLEIFVPVRTDIPRPPRPVIWENLLEAPPSRPLLEYIRTEPFSL